MKLLARAGAPPWFAALVGVSALLLLVTQFSYAFARSGSISTVLFWLGLGGENNIGSWWSGMLLALGAVCAFDGAAGSTKPRYERRGWYSLGLALLLLSFDEVASLHEYLSTRGMTYLAVLGVIGLALVGYAMVQLARARVSKRKLELLLAGFGLLATVPVHEVVQHALEWPDPVVYGVRAMLEEGTEIVAMLMFVWVLRANSVAALQNSLGLFSALARRRRAIVAGGVVLWPALTALTLVLPYPGGPADWLAALLFLLCALLVIRTAVQNGTVDARSKWLIALFVSASAAANAVKVGWNPLVLGAPVSLRGVALALGVLAAVVLLRASGRRMNTRRALLVAVAIAGSAAVWSTSQLAWCALPPLLALWMYSIESRGVTVTSAPPATAVAAGT
jgi:hypothetical protein